MWEVVLQLSNFQICAEERLAWTHCSSAEVLCLPCPAGSPPRQQSHITSPQGKDLCCKGGDWKEDFKERKEVSDLELRGSLSYFLSEPGWIRAG